MGGGWFGYVYSIFGCGLVLALIGGSTAFLYLLARAKGKDEGLPKVRVTSVHSSARADEPTDGPDAA